MKLCSGAQQRLSVRLMFGFEAKLTVPAEKLLEHNTIRTYFESRNLTTSIKEIFVTLFSNRTSSCAGLELSVKNPFPVCGVAKEPRNQLDPGILCTKA